MKDTPIRILVIEDNPGDVRLIREMLKATPSQGWFEVEAVDRLQRGIEQLRDQDVDVILLDLALPDCTGLQTFLQVQTAAPQTAIIVLTGQHDEDLAFQALRDGAQDFLTKAQLDGDRLQRSIRYAYERKRAEEELRLGGEVQRLLLSELDHRVRNNLTSLITLIDLSQRKYNDVRKFAESMRSRVQTMVTVHSLLSRAQWKSVRLERLLQSLLPADLNTRCQLTGPSVVIPVRQVTALGIVLNEFLINSQKYGCLGRDSGQLDIEWNIHNDTVPSTKRVNSRDRTPKRLLVTWRERGGPRIDINPEPGIGTSIVEGLVKSELGGSVSFSFPPDGAHHTLNITLDPVADLPPSLGFLTTPRD